MDIIEGVNDANNNQVTLHTNEGCKAQQTGFSGKSLTEDCNIGNTSQPTNAGCGIQSDDTNSFGQGFNSIGGGVYATEWTSDAIKIWFFPRSSPLISKVVSNPDPSTFGTQAAMFANTDCNIDQHFKDMNLIFDTTFCGDWAGKLWSEGACASKAPTCQQYVAENPEAFADAFWSVNAVKVFQMGGGNNKRGSTPMAFKV